MNELIKPYFADFAPWLLKDYGALALWVWLCLPAFFTLAYFVSVTVVIGMRIVLSWSFRGTRKPFYQRHITPLFAPLRLLVTALCFASLVHLLPLSEDFQGNLQTFVSTLVTLAITWGLFHLLTTSIESCREHLIAHDKLSASAILPLLRKLAKAVLAVMMLLFLLQNWGYDVATLLAGLGIGGVAIALASQKTVENLFGGVSVTLDQPVRVGDFINFGDNVGTVEDIGLRSVTIRTLQRTRVTIPNAAFSEMALENMAARDKLLIHTTIGVRYDTTPDQIRYIVMKINELFVAHPKAENEGRARFSGFGDSALNIEIFAYIRSADWVEFLAIREDIFLRIMDIVSEAGSDFAFPSTTVYLERSHGISSAQKEKTGAKMGQLRKDAGYFFPHVPPEAQKNMQDSLPYPPTGAAKP